MSHMLKYQFDRKIKSKLFLSDIAPPPQKTLSDMNESVLRTQLYSFKNQYYQSEDIATILTVADHKPMTSSIRSVLHSTKNKHDYPKYDAVYIHTPE